MKQEKSREILQILFFTHQQWAVRETFLQRISTARKMAQTFFQTEAFSPLMTALVNPASSIAFNPLIVIPPGVVTRSISTSG